MQNSPKGWRWSLTLWKEQCSRLRASCVLRFLEWLYGIYFCKFCHQASLWEDLYYLDPHEKNCVCISIFVCQRLLIRGFYFNLYTYISKYTVLVGADVFECLPNSKLGLNFLFFFLFSRSQLNTSGIPPCCYGVTVVCFHLRWYLWFPPQSARRLARTANSSVWLGGRQFPAKTTPAANQLG